MIRTDTVLTLRDLRGEHADEFRRIPWGTRWPDYHFLLTRDLIELAGIAMEWRKDDRIPVPEGTPEQRDDEVLGLVKGIAGVIASNERISLHGADCSVLVSWEPID